MDIKDFDLLITREILDKASYSAEEHVAITEKDTRTIFHCRKSLLFSNGVPWRKKTPDDCLDVAMGSYDGAEVCELVGLLVLSQLSNIANKEDVGLYRDDGLVILRNVNSGGTEITNNSIIQIFRDLGFQIEIVTCLHSVNFLETMLDLKTGTYRPHRKPSDAPPTMHTYIIQPSTKNPKATPIN